MAEVLELPHLVEEHRMTQVQVGRGGIEPGLHPQRTAGLEFFDEILLDQQLIAAALEDIQLFFDFHVQFAVAPLAFRRPGREYKSPNNVIWNVNCAL